MSLPAESLASEPVAPPPPEQRFVLRGVSWERYTSLRESFDSPGLRMTYYHGALELMSPSPLHESSKKSIARLFELWALERDVEVQGYGSTTFKDQLEDAGLEPDECYVIGDRPLGEAPDLAIEVIVTRPALPKLPICAALGVREVWFFERGRFSLHALRGDTYAPIATSELVPGLDLALLAEHVGWENQHDAVKAYRDRLRG